MDVAPRTTSYHRSRGDLHRWGSLMTWYTHLSIAGRAACTVPPVLGRGSALCTARADYVDCPRCRALMRSAAGCVLLGMPL